jgi:hypothetical protein
MNRFSSGQYVAANPQFAITPTGASAANTVHSVALLGNANGIGAADVTLPDGQHLTSGVLGLSYYDTASGQAVMIGEIQDCQGQLTPSGNEALYTNAFQGVVADLLYVNQIAGLEQFVVLREQLPPPAIWNLNPSTTMLEVITEFTNAPTPGITSQNLNGVADQQLDFGAMQMRRGYAFALGSETNKVRVTKQWLLMEGRQCLVEQVPFTQIQAQLNALPPSSSGGASLRSSPDSVLHHVASRQILPGRKPTPNRATAFALAKAAPKGKGFVMDYTLNSSHTNFTFQGDTTYFISSGFFLRGVTTIEGGAVIKATNTSPVMTVWDTVVCKASPYHLATITASDDNSVGQAIPGSTGNPSGYYFGGFDTFGCALSNIRFAYANTAFLLEGPPVTLTNCQFVNCNNAFSPEGGEGDVNLYNALLYQVGTVFEGGSPLTVNAQNVTIHLCDTLADTDDGGSGSSLALTNCLLVGITNWGNVSTYTTNSTVILASDAGVFQTVGGGGHYLADGSPYRNAGTTNIDAGLLGDIAQKTTYPPIVYSNVTISANTTFAPQALRDTNAANLGFHYDGIDYAFKWVRVTNATVTFQPGTAIGAFGPYGIGLVGGAQLVSEGAASSLNHIARYNMIQECASTNWAGAGDLIEGNWLGGAPSQATLSFTDLSIPAQDGEHFQYFQYGTVYAASDCQFHGGQFSIDGYNVTLTNSLFERVATVIADQDSDIYPMVRNCLFYGGSAILDDLDGDPWIFRDNLFDQTVISEPDWGMDAAYNGYTPGTSPLTPTNSHDVRASIAYQTSWLGNYYQPPNSAFIAKGSTAANNVGLYWFTTQTNQSVEGTSIVDIGFHYVATDGSGNPLDLDGDGIPDYLEDLNDNGMPDAWELMHFGTIGNDPNGDPDYDGLSNLSEYLYGTDPLHAEGVSIWVGCPNGTSSLP